MLHRKSWLFLQELRAEHVGRDRGSGGTQVAVDAVPPHGLDHCLPLPLQGRQVIWKGRPPSHLKRSTSPSLGVNGP